MAAADVLPSVHDRITSPQNLPSVRSNQGKSVAPASTGWLTSVPADSPVEELQARYERDGYLFMKGILPRSDVLKCREAYFKFLSPTGVLQPNSAPVER